MDAAILVSLVAVLISGGALWVSYRAYNLVQNTRHNDKRLDLRLRAADLLRDANQVVTDLERPGITPTPPSDYIDNVNLIRNRINNFHKDLYGDLSDISENEIDDMLVTLREYEGDFTVLKRKVGWR